jgi:hypothetical protein
MSRHVPTDFSGKVRAVRQTMAAMREQPCQPFKVTEEVQPGVRLVVTARAETPVVFSLWSEPRDVAEICGDAAYPAAGGLLAIDKVQADDLLRAAGLILDLDSMVRSETLPGIHYVLIDRISNKQLRLVVEKLLEARAASA